MRWASSRSAPSSAAIAPTPTGTAACIAWPRSFSSFAVVGRSNDPAADSAEYSPRLWPATNCAALSQVDTAFAGQRAEHRQRMGHDRRLGIFGELELVLRPLAHQLEEVLAECFVDLAEHVAGGALASASAAPMPTDWLPCPGKRNARIEIPVVLCLGSRAD